MSVERRAKVTWSGTLADGSGMLESGSGALRAQPYSLTTRIGEPAGQTSPEELIAAAHAACFSMAMAFELTQIGASIDDIAVSARCVEGPVDDGFAITNIDLDVTVRSHGLSPEALESAISRAHAGCPVSRALSGNVNMTVTARLG
jgi:osmotically inducible protein OsmC